MYDQSNQPRQVKPVSMGFLADLIRQARLAWRLFFDPRVALWLKIIVPVSLMYVISPVDFVPDVIPGLGQLDDLAVLVLGVKLFIELCPPEIVREHWQALMGEANWRVEPEQSSSSSSASQVVDAPYEVKKD
jgi:uncharacterized membrane protein YkvA (DUF1232 family)